MACSSSSVNETQVGILDDDARLVHGTQLGEEKQGTSVCSASYLHRLIFMLEFLLFLKDQHNRHPSMILKFSKLYSTKPTAGIPIENRREAGIQLGDCMGDKERRTGVHVA